jgi:hypothetical protein
MGGMRTARLSAEAENEVDTDNWGKPIPWSTVRIWALETGGADEPGVLWCGTIPGGLFRSADSGSSWELNRQLWVGAASQRHLLFA